MDDIDIQVVATEIYIPINPEEGDWSTEAAYAFGDWIGNREFVSGLPGSESPPLQAHYRNNASLSFLVHHQPNSFGHLPVEELPHWFETVKKVARRFKEKHPKKDTVDG